jgi:hypothetical protein
LDTTSAAQKVIFLDELLEILVHFASPRLSATYDMSAKDRHTALVEDAVVSPLY